VIRWTRSPPYGRDNVEFTLNTSVRPPTITVTTRGELDIFSAHTLSRELSTARDRGCRRVLVDVSDVSFVDASALGVLARAQAALSADQVTMAFVETTTRFRRVCAMTGLDLVFDLPPERVAVP
jgi:anti-sigma B factor antagonist